MKRLYKIIILFIIIFLVGVYYTVISINTTLSEDDKTEVIYITPETSQNSITVL